MVDVVVINASPRLDESLCGEVIQVIQRPLNPIPGSKIVSSDQTCMMMF